MEPTARERHIRRAAKLYLYVCRKLNKKSSPRIVAAAKDIYGNNDDTVVAGLCALMRSLSKEQIEIVVYNSKDPMSRHLADWWEQHLLNDRKRERAEKIAKRKQEFIDSAKNKLTASERKALGL